MLTICSALSASRAWRAAFAASISAALCVRFIVARGATLVSVFVDFLVDGGLDVVLDEDEGGLVFFRVAPSAGGGFVCTIKERVCLVVERVATGIVSLVKTNL